MRRRLLRYSAVVAVLFILGLTGLFWLKGQGTPVPVLMYHHFSDQSPAVADTVVSAQSFEQQLQALSQAGYTTITPQQLIDYQQRNGTLPEKPILITMDDGYSSNLAIAAPLLEKYHMTATVFVIGINVGRSTYPHSGEALSPLRFGWEEVRPWVERGVLVVQSHTYDLHQRADYGFSGRDGVLPLDGERDQDYRAALEDDFTRAAQDLERELGTQLVALAFPFGLNSPTCVEVLRQMGVKLSFTTNYGVSRVVPGIANTMQRMDRCWINDDLTGDELISRLTALSQAARADLF